jgi:hypothetical protein
MACSTWLTWPDAIYDFGSQLYYPWQMIQGRHLYVDIAYFNGPLSQYFNAAMFAIFGTSVHTLMLVNGAIVLAVIAMVFRLICRLSGSLTATVACVVFVMNFAFSRYIGIGNYNWICPYTHEVTHGVALSLGMVLALDSFLRSGRGRWLGIASGLLGLVFLTKAEIFAPAAGVFVLGFALRRRIGRSDPALWSISEPAWGLLPFAAVLLVAYALIALHAGKTAANHALLGTWPWVFDHRISQLYFYRHGLGVDDLPGNLRHMLWIGCMSLVLIAGAIGVGIAPRRLRFIAMLIFIAELAGLIWNWSSALQIARPWPVFVGIIAILSMWQAWRPNQPGREKAALRAMLAVLALGLLAKMLFNARPWQYGFSLAFPAAIVLVEAVVGWLPTWAGSHSSQMRRAGVVLVAVVALCLHANQISGSVSRIKVGAGSDQFMAGANGEEVNRVCGIINAVLPRDGTLAVMPQGLMLNFLTRRADSIPTVNMMPPEVMSTGEDRIIEQLNAHPPDVIVLSETDLRDGAFILRDGDYHYAQKIVAWVMRHYQLVSRDAGQQLKLTIWRPKKSFEPQMNTDAHR